MTIIATETKTLRPWDGKEFFHKRDFNPIPLPVAEVKERTIEWCKKVGMEEPPWS